MQQRDLAIYRLFQMISPSLPIGSFTYSQGLELAVEAGWVSTMTQFEKWLETALFNSLATLEVPLIRRFCHALRDEDVKAIANYASILYRSRETRELRAEERQRGMALNTLLSNLDSELANKIALLDKNNVETNQLLGLCIASQYWGIEPDKLIQGYLWSWAENLVMAGVKLVPLGQTDGQRLLMKLSEQFPAAVAHAETIEDWMLGSFTPSLSIASSLHETQYSRLFRS